MKILDFIKGVWRRLFSLRDIKSALNLKPAISQEMLDMIEIWYNSYCGKAVWIKDSVHSLNLEQSITREFANIVLNEMEIKVSNSNLNDILQTAIKDINMHFQEGLATGAMIIKPLGINNNKVQFVSANAFIPIEYDSNGKLLKVIFPEFKQIGEKFYTRLEYHCLDEKGLTITNKAYVSSTKNNLGTEIPLTYVGEWQNIQPYSLYPLMNRQAFGYYRNPIKNTIDGSHCGVSIFNNAMELIRLTDIQFSRLDWEFESGERAIHVDMTALNNNGRVEHLNKRLYKYVDIDNGNSNLFQEFSPTLRQSDLIAGLEEYKRNIEFEVGLSYGDISNPSTIAKTATEIKSAKDRKYNTVTAIQKNLKECLEDLTYALAFYNSMATSSYSFNCNFNDSILIDEDTERKRDIQDLNLGILRPEEYRAKWYSEDIETALKNLPQSAGVME